MNPLEAISGAFFNYNSFFYWRDILEILFFTSLFYYAALWLKKDTQKNLLPYFYGYCALALSAYLFGLTSISTILFLFAPVTAMIFILIHQDMLQKNIIALKNITPAKRIQLDWLETLIRTSVTAINNGKTITCVIERTDSLQEVLKTPFLFNAQLEGCLLDILLASTSFDEQQIIWVNTQGHLVGINAAWAKTADLDFLEHGIKKLPAWKQQAIFFSTKTDAIILHINPTTRTFDVVMNGMIIDRMHATKTLELIKKYVLSKQTPQWGAVTHEKILKKRTSKQSTH